MNRLKELRQKMNLTRDDIEAKTGIKRGTYSNYENEKTEPKQEVWQKLADFFNVSVPYLQGYEMRKIITNVNAVTGTKNYAVIDAAKNIVYTPFGNKSDAEKFIEENNNGNNSYYYR